MTRVFVHELAVQAKPLMERLRRVLSEDPSASAEGLLRRAVIEHRPKPRLVLTGQFSAGKSTLIKALTDGAVSPLIGADISTDEVTEYDWDEHVILVDTPGVKAGVRRHDDLAREAIGNSDFILFVVNVGLFDDAGRDYIRWLAHDQRKYDQMIVVVSQTSKMSAPPGVREEAVRDALGTVTYLPPVLEVDAEDYLDSLSEDASDGLLRKTSGIDRLREEINTISSNRGQLAQLRQPFQLIRQLCDEALPLFADDPAEQQALAVLANQRKAVTERRVLIGTQLTSAEASFKSESRADVLRFVNAATELGDTAPSQSALETEFAKLESELRVRLERHAEAFGDRINDLAEQQVDTLAAQLIEIGNSHRALALLHYSAKVEAHAPDHITVQQAGPGGSGGSDARLGWLQDMQGWLKKSHLMWGAGGGVKNSSGTLGHTMVEEVGGFFGKKFRPWQAARWANNLGKAARGLDAAISVALAAVDVVREANAQHRAQIAAERKHAAFVTEVMGYVSQIAADARAQLSAIIDPPFDEFLASIDGQQAEILDASGARTRQGDELRAIAAEADRLLERSSVPVVIEAEIIDESQQ